jgi:hypothetical protein
MAEPSEGMSRKDFLAGVLFMGLGGIGAWIAGGYSVGTASRMGAGYFPLVVSSLLICVGAILLLKNLRSALASGSVRRASELELRPLVRAYVVVLLCLLTFAALIERAGLAATSLVCVAISYYGARGLMERKGAAWEGVVIALVLSAFSVAVFVYGIGLPMRIWPR